MDTFQLMLTIEPVLRASQGLIGNAAGTCDYQIHVDCSFRSLVSDDRFAVASFKTNSLCASSDGLPCLKSYMGPQCSSRVGMQPPQCFLALHTGPKSQLSDLS